MLNETTVEYLLLACALLAILLPIVGGRAQLPLLNVLARWMRWFLFAAIFAFILRIAELSLRPDWVHFVAGLGIAERCNANICKATAKSGATRGG